MKKIAIIGAWPAGLMTVASILEQSSNTAFEINIFEKNASFAKKLLISGGGRCNVTTGITDKKILATKYTRWWDFIKSAMGQFWPKKCYEWFESHGVNLKIENDLRVFPLSNDGNEVLWVFEKIIANYRNNVRVYFRERVENISKNTSHDVLQNNKWTIITKNSNYCADIVVIATGWNAYAHTGSSGDGYGLARKLWHTITPLWPSLSSFLTKEEWIHTLSGISFPQASIIYKNISLSWDLLCTHFGISWPLSFMLASNLAFIEIDSINVLFVPISTMDSNSWDQFLQQYFQQFPKKSLHNILATKLPKKFCDIFIDTFFVHIKNTFPSSIAKKDRASIADALWNGIPITLTGRRPWDEFVTAGGISTDEIQKSTMQSMIHDDLYFVGEILNVDGYTGGLSLQICWSSWYVAGKHIASLLK